MKKSELRSLIRECITEVLTETQLNQLFRQFVPQIVPPAHRTDFVELIYPFVNKSTENPENQAAIVKKLIAASVGAKLSDAAIAELKDYGIDITNREVAAKLSKYNPFISKFLTAINQQSVV